MLADANIVIPGGRRLALLAEPFEHARQVVDLLVGVTAPSVGRVIRRANVSFPAGETKIFDAELSVRRNVQHAARMYVQDSPSIVRFVEHCAVLGQDFEKPFGALPRNDQRSLSHIIAYAIPFEIYVLSETLRGVRSRLNEVAVGLLKARAVDCGVIAPVRDVRLAREFYDGALVLRHDEIGLFDDVEGSIEALGKGDRMLQRAAQARHAGKLVQGR